MADPSSVIKNNLVPAVNNHDIDKVLQCFDDNAIVKLNTPLPGLSNTTLKGKNEIRQYFEKIIPGGKGEISNLKTSGDQVTYDVRLQGDVFRNAGLNQVNIHNTVTVKNDKIVSFNPQYAPDVVQKFQQGGQSQGQGKGTRQTSR